MQESNPIATSPLVFAPRHSLTTLATFVRSHAADFISGLLLTIMGLQMLMVISRKSITVDELVMIPSAYYHLVDGDFQYVNEHPPLSKILAAIPLLFIQPNEQKINATNSPGITDPEWATLSTFWDRNTKKFETISFWTRLPLIILTLGLGVLIFIFARSLFGPRTAVLAVALFSLEPTILAHGRVVQTDVVAAFGYLLFFMALYWYATALTWRRAVYLGAAAAVAILAKYSMLLVGLVLPPAFIVLWWLNSRRRDILAHALVVIVTMLVAVNAAYFFQLAPLNDAGQAWIRTSFAASSQTVIEVTHWFSYIVPNEFVLGILFQYVHNQQGHSASLLGRYSQMGWWYYFPVAFALKTTLPFLLLTITSTGRSILKLIRNRDPRIMWLLAPAAIYSVFVLFSHINIGVRYLLPMFPFLIILGARLLDELLSVRRIFARVVVVIMCAWLGFEAIRAYPNHMSYMNQIASRAPHWWYLSDSNVEWGDDLRELAVYLQQRGESRVADATLGGFGVLRFYGIERVDPLDEKESGSDNPPRYLAIGASYLNGSTVPWGGPGSGRDTLEGRVHFFDDFRKRTPEAIIGNSIYVFRLTQ